MEKAISSPFLDLLKEENLSRIKIDKELIPIFKIVIYNIDEYFKNNNLINCRDWESFFKRFLLSQTDEQITIRLQKTGDGVAGEYNKNKKTLSLKNATNANILCHEFIHFLIMHDSNSFNAKVSDSTFFNEGLTELLTSKIMKINKNSSSYLYEFQMMEFYCKMYQNKNPFLYFLYNKFAFDDVDYAPVNIIRSSERFYETNSLTSLLEIQREIIVNATEELEINSFDDFVNFITMVNQRIKFDSEYIENIFSTVVDKYMMTLGLKDLQASEIRSKLLNFCKMSNKFQLYGDNAVAEYLVDDLHIAFDKSGNRYNDFPLNGEKYRGQVSFDTSKGITIVHRDKKYKVDINKMNCRNWAPIYRNSLQILRNDITNIENNTLLASSSHHKII